MPIKEIEVQHDVPEKLLILAQRIEHILVCQLQALVARVDQEEVFQISTYLGCMEQLLFDRQGVVFDTKGHLQPRFQLLFAIIALPLGLEASFVIVRCKFNLGTLINQDIDLEPYPAILVRAFLADLYKCNILTHHFTSFAWSKQSAIRVPSFKLLCHQITDELFRPLITLIFSCFTNRSVELSHFQLLPPCSSFLKLFSSIFLLSGNIVCQIGYYFNDDIVFNFFFFTLAKLVGKFQRTGDVTIIPKVRFIYFFNFFLDEFVLNELALSKTFIELLFSNKRTSSREWNVRCHLFDFSIIVVCRQKSDTLIKIIPALVCYIVLVFRAT